MIEKTKKHLCILFSKLYIYTYIYNFFKIKYFFKIYLQLFSQININFFGNFSGFLINYNKNFLLFYYYYKSVFLNKKNVNKAFFIRNNINKHFSPSVFKKTKTQKNNSFVTNFNSHFLFIYNYNISLIFYKKCEVAKPNVNKKSTSFFFFFFLKKLFINTFDNKNNKKHYQLIYLRKYNFHRFSFLFTYLNYANVLKNSSFSFYSKLIINLAYDLYFINYYYFSKISINLNFNRVYVLII